MKVSARRLPCPVEQEPRQEPQADLSGSYWPGGGLGLLLIVIIVLVLMGRI